MSREYDAFGNTVLQRGTDVNGRKSLPWFSSKVQDEETGLYYYGYRYYSSITGGWISRDPIGVAGGANTYSFVENKSQNYRDFLGLLLLEHNNQPDLEADWRGFEDDVKRGAGQEVLRNGAKTAGLTLNLWPKKPHAVCEPLGDKWCLRVADLSLRFDQRYFEDTIDTRGRGTVAHEQLHVEVGAKHWNKHVRFTNPFHGTVYDTEPECDDVVRRIHEDNDMNWSNSKDEDDRIDQESYPHLFVKEPRQKEIADILTRLDRELADALQR